MSATFWALNGGNPSDVVITAIHGASPATTYPWTIASNGTTAVVCSRVAGAESNLRLYSTSDGVTFVAPSVTDSTSGSYNNSARSAVYANSKFIIGGSDPAGAAGRYIDGDSSGASFTLRDDSSGVAGTHGLMWDGSRFLSVGGTKIATSTTGLNNAWTDATINAGYNFYGLAFDGTTYVAVGQTGAVYTSTNRTTWTARTSGTTDLLHSVTYESSIGLFVAVGYGVGVIITSPDGVTWTSRTNPAVGTFRKVVWSSAHNKFFAVGNKVVYSDDGITWVASSYPSVTTFYDIAFIGTTALVTTENDKKVYKSDKAFIF